MKTVHEPVLLKEVLEYLSPEKNDNAVDGTLGGGGHAEAILAATAPSGRLLGLDWDREAVVRATERLSKYSHRTTLINNNYKNIKQIVYETGFAPINLVLLDLGLSLDQLQSSRRGFSFQLAEPLDMRFSLDNELTAEFIINNYSDSELIRIFRDYGEEKSAKRIAEAIVAERKKQPILNTLQLVEIITKNKFIDYRKKSHPATQVFQALRIAVNHEFENIEMALNDFLDVLAPGGRFAVITFHSLEDRLVKDYFKQESRDCLCPPELPVCRCGHIARVKILTKKAISPSDEEISRNFRSRSAKLRVVQKV